MPSTIQHKVVHVLVARLRQKLPCYSGDTLDTVEADPPTQQAIDTLVLLSPDELGLIAWALCELLDRLAKTDSQSGHLTLQVLQSQLFILKVLSACMAARWSKDTNVWLEPNPLDDACAKYILSVMILFMRQTAVPEVPLMLQTRSTDITFRDYEDNITLSQDPPPPPDFSDLRPTPSAQQHPSKSPRISIRATTPLEAASTVYEKTHMSLVRSALNIHNLIAKYVGRVIFHISASNWTVVHDKLQTRILQLAGSPDKDLDLVDLQLISYSILDRTRLTTLLHQLSSLLVNMRRDAQAAIALHLRVAIWNWIDIFSAEFNEAVRTRGKLDGVPERVFDVLHSLSHNAPERTFWPTLTILNCLCSERVAADFQYGNTGMHKGRKEVRFSEHILKHLTGSKHAEIALACAIDMCRAAAYIEPSANTTETDVPLRLVASDIAHEIKSALSSSPGSRGRPFWESQEDIDISLYADGLVAIYRFLPYEDSKQVFLSTMELERSKAAKTSAIRAAFTIVQDASRFPWQKSYIELAEWVAPRCRDVLRSAGIRRTDYDLDAYGGTRRAATKPKAKRIFPEPLNEREVLILGILSLWRANPIFFMKGITGPDDVENWVSVAVKLWDAPIDISVKVSTSATMRKVSEATFFTPATDPNYVLLTDIVKLSLPQTLMSVVANLLTARSDLDSQRLWVALALQCIDVYVAKLDVPHVKAVQVDPRRVPAFALAEIAFLVTLPSADNTLSQLAAKGLRLVSHAERQAGAPVNVTMTDQDRAKRDPIYEQLGDPRVLVVSRVMHQKRIRKLVRLLSFSSGVHVVVWEECYWRWVRMNEMVTSAFVDAQREAGVSSGVGMDLTGTLSVQAQEIRNHWQNFTLFLSALSGACIQENPKSQSILESLSSIIPSHILPDKLRIVQSPAPLVGDFIAKLIDWIGVGDRQIREVVRDALGVELSPRLYGKLIRNLEESVLALEMNCESGQFDSFAMVLDQIMSVLKLISENQSVTIEDVMNVEMSPVMHTLISFILRFPEREAYTARIKIKFCNLCESVCVRGDTLTMRKDSPVRHEILDVVLSWMVGCLPDTPLDPNALELNMACLKAAVRLLDRLQLRPSDAGTGDDIMHVVSRLFNKYSSALLSSLSTCQPTTSDSASDRGSLHQKMKSSQKEAELRELVITGLTHLVSANSESGFKQCLPLAYDQDPRKRIIFAHVFARVIGQGTVFDGEDKGVTKARHMALCELVRSQDLVLAMAICEICPPGESDMIVSVLLNTFDTRQSLMALIKRMIEKEVAQTAHESGLFRGNSTCTRFLTAFARLHGYHYLRSLIQPLVNTMMALPPESGYEIDPTKAFGQDIAMNQKNVEYVASTFLQLLSDSLPVVPSMFREICAHIERTVSSVWPDARYAAMGAFIFLRFISPAVVSPETVDIEVPKSENSPTLRRGLMVIAKIIQNLANNIFFGKEAHMTILNKFLETNIVEVTTFLSNLHKNVNGDEGDHWNGGASDETDVIVLHRFFHKHADKIGKELLSLSRPHTDGSGVETSVASGKKAWDGLCALLVDLGPPMEVPRMSTLHTDQHREYLELMERHKNRSTASVAHLFVEIDVKDNVAVFILRLASLDVEGLDIELFMYHILKTLSSETHKNRPFDIVLDCTSFSSISEVPLQWLKYCAELIPYNIRNRFMTTRILNPNSLAQKYLRRLYNISAGNPLCMEIKVYTSVMKLMEDVQKPALPLLAYPVSLEQETHQEFQEVKMNLPQKVPVTLRVGTTHIRVTSVKSLPISPGLSCQSTEIIPLAEISDIYNILSGAEQHEFIIRRRQGFTEYFSSPQREAIIKCVRSAKGRLKEVSTPLTERFSRFSNVPATLLHVGLLSVDLNDEELRGAAYDLLGAVCNYLNYSKNPIVACRAGFIPGDPIAFVVNLSEKLADFAPQLTLDFIHEVSAAMTGMDKSAVAQRISCLQYMSPWIKNLSHFANPTHPLYERSGARLRDCIRTLTDLSVAFPEITTTVQKHIWAEVTKLDSNIIDKILDELVRTATDGGIGTRRCETISHIIAALSSINVRGRIYSKLRKALSKVSAKICNTLTDYPNWTEISTLIRLCLVVGSQSTHPGQNYIYVPEIIHLIALVAHEGPSLVRKSVYGMLVNLLQSLYLSRPDDSTEQGLQKLINDSSSADVLKLFGLRRETPTSEYTNIEQLSDKETLNNLEELVQFLIRVMDVSAGTTGLLNIWKARWMSLVTATAFQLSPAIQTRSFIVLASLATSEVDDDYLYQILVAFRSALSKANETNTMALISMLRCICKILPAIVDCRYISSLFWLAVALLQSSHIAFYVEATTLLCVTLEGMERQGLFQDSTVHSVLLEAREPLEEVTSQLDELLRISFDASFSFSLASIIFKGFRHRPLREAAETCLRTLLRITSAHEPREPSPDGSTQGGLSHPPPEVLGYFIGLLSVSSSTKTYLQLLSDCGITDPQGAIDPGDEDDVGVPRITPKALGIGNGDQTTALLVASFAGTMVTSAQGADAETDMLYCLLSNLAYVYPDVVAVVYESIQEQIKNTFANSTNASIIRSVSNIFRIALRGDSSTSTPTGASSASSASRHLATSGSSSTLSTVDEGILVGPGKNHLNALDELGMQGLANSFGFLPPGRGHATKMINWIPALVNSIF